MARRDLGGAARLMVLPAFLAGLLSGFVLGGQPEEPAPGVLAPVAEDEPERSTIGKQLVTIGGPRMATPRFWLAFAGGFLVIEIAGAVYMSRNTPDDGARLTQMVDMVKARQTAKEAAEKEQAEKEKAEKGKDS